MTNKREKAQNITDIMQQIQQKCNNMANFERQLSQPFLDKINMFFFRYEYLSFFLFY